MAIESTEITKRLFRRYFQLIWKSSPRLVVIRGILSLFEGLVPLLILYIFKLLIEAFESGIENIDIETIWSMVAIWLVATLLQTMSTHINAYYAELHNFELTREVQEKIHEQALSLPYSYYDTHGYHDTFYRAQRDATSKPQKFLTDVSALVSQTASLIGVLVFLISFNIYIGILTVVLSIPGLLISLYFARKMDDLKVRLTPLERLGKYLHRVITFKDYAHEIRIFQTGSRLSKMFNANRLDTFLMKKGVLVKLLRGLLSVSVLENLLVVGLIIYLVLDFRGGALSIGAFVFYIQAIQKGQTSLKNCSKSLVSIYEQKLFLKHLFTFLSLKHQADKSGAPIAPIKSLSFEQVSFSYPETAEQVLKKVNFQAKKGEVIGIVGLNGSGKSTLTKLISGLYRPEEGKILVNGLDLSSQSMESYRDQVSAIFQNFSKYKMTLQFNIGLGQKESNDVRLHSAIEQSGFDTVFKTLKDGTSTQFGREYKGGKELSGGEWQKVALTRALYHNSSLLLLDEPTSFFDAISEERFFNNLKNLSQNKIVILVSHGVTGIKHCDKILVMKDGSITEEGSHDTLLERKKDYHELFRKLT